MPQQACPSAPSFPLADDRLDDPRHGSQLVLLEVGASQAAHHSTGGARYVAKAGWLLRRIERRDGSVAESVTGRLSSRFPDGDVDTEEAEGHILRSSTERAKASGATAV